jgi:hypothetical protein
MTKTRRYGLLILISLLICVYTFTNSGRTHIVDEVSLFGVTESIGLRRAVDTNAIAWTQWVNSPGEVLGAFGPEGDVYSKKGPAPAFLAVPWYLLLHGLTWLNIHIGLMQGALLWNGIVTALTAALLWLTANRLGYGDRTGMWLGLLFGLCTIAWPYANQFFGEPLSAFSLLICFYGILSWRRTGAIAWVVLAGIGAALAIATVTAHTILVGIFGLYLVAMWWDFGVSSVARSETGEPIEDDALLPASHAHRSTRSVLLALAAFAIPIAIAGGLLLLYNLARFGNPFTTGYHFDSGEGFTTPIWQGLWGLIFSPYRSVLLHTPLLLASLIALPAFVRRHRWEGITIATLTVTLICMYSMWWMWWGGYAWGPRFLVPLTPLWVLPLAPLLERAINRQTAPSTPRFRVVILLFAGLALVSFAVQVLAVSINFVNYETLLRTEYFPTNWENPLEFGPPAQSISDLFLSPVFGQVRLLLAGGLAANSDLAWLWAGGQVLWPLLFVGVAAIITAGLSLAVWARGVRLGDAMLAIPSPAMTVLLVALPLIVTATWLGYASDDPVYGNEEQGYHAALRDICAHQREGDVIVTVAPTGYQIPMNWLGTHCHDAIDIYGYATSSMNYPEAEQVMRRILETAERIHFVTGGLPPNDPENTLERWLAENAFKADDRWFDTDRLLHYATPGKIELVQYVPHSLLLADVAGNRVTIVQSRVQESASPGEIIPVEIGFQLNLAAPSDLRWFVQLLSPDGAAVAQLDTGPDDNYRAFSSLPPVALHTERAGLQLPDDLSPGRYQVIAGLYNPMVEGAPRLRAADGREYLVLGELTVEASQP